MKILDQFKLVRVRIMAESLLTLLMTNLLQLIVFIFSWNSEDFSRTNITDDGFIAENSTFDLPTESPLAVVNNVTTFGCLSPKERYHIGLLDDQLSCFELMTQGPCKPNQIIYLDSDDSGICDCENSLLLYSTETRECYQQNTQGPCEDGEWFTLVTVLDGNETITPSCQPLPDGCLANGDYVFWSPDYSEGSVETSEKQCWALGTRGPCSQDEILERYPTNTIGCKSKSFNIARRPYRGYGIDEMNEEDEEAERKSSVGRSVAVAGMRPCAPGSRRTQTGKCREISNFG